MDWKHPDQLLNLTGQVVLVTGGASGIGAGIAERFSQAGAQVFVCDQKAIPSPATPWRAILADLIDPRQVETVFEQIPALDILINSAGIYPSAGLLEMTPEEWDQTLAVDLKAAFLCTQAAARRMVAAGKGGAIINIGSTEAVSPARGHCHYAAAKAGLEMFSRAAALELGTYGIRVNTVSPGLINRPSLSADWPEGYQRFLRSAPLGRVGEPRDIADACLFLASDAARWITGAHLVVDGGVLTCPVY